MPFESSAKTRALQQKLLRFFDEHIYPNESAYRQEIANHRAVGTPFVASQIMDALKSKARAAGLWNLFLPHSASAPEALSNFEYAPLCEIMGRVGWSAEVFNCSAPDTGNMEILERYGTEAQKKEWLEPLLAGEIRSAFLMTEPHVASSDATNIECSIRREGNEYVINGRKWWSTGANHERCALFIVMGKTDPKADRHKQQSMILVPAKAKGVTVLRYLSIFGYNDAPHGHAEVELVDVRVPASNILLGEGRGFEIAQGRLGPGRVHHCMRSIAVGERALALMCGRLDERIAFGKPLSAQSVWQERIAESRCLIDQARLLVLHTARRMDEVGNKAARSEIAMIKVAVPNATLKVIDWAIQAFGAAGVSSDFQLAELWASQRTMRIVDGPDEVHRNTIAKIELERQRVQREKAKEKLKGSA